MTTMTRRIGLVCGVTAAGALSLASLAACGTQSSTSSSPASAAATTTSSAAPSKHAGRNTANAAYRQCLEQNGVVFPSKGAHPSMGAQPSGSPSAAPGQGRAHKAGPPAGVSQDTWDKAVAACASLKPSKAHTAPTS